jgi:phosphonate transport system substrate-binding protein
MQPAVYLAQRIEDTKFTSVFIQGSNNNMTPSLSNITDVEGRSLALGSQTSTSGSLMPMYYLTQSNVTPSSIMYMGSHDATVEAVINGEAQVGALNSVVWKNRVAANATGGTSVFYTTEEYVDYLVSVLLCCVLCVLYCIAVVDMVIDNNNVYLPIACAC